MCYVQAVSRVFARIPLMATTARSPVLGVMDGCVEPLMSRKGAKNRGWFYRAVEAQKAAAANKRIDEYGLIARCFCAASRGCPCESGCMGASPAVSS